jgi:hypothetical protein
MPHADQWVAVASFNNHEATLTNAYGLTETSAGSDKPTHSGCVGFGFDRLVYGVLCQFGCDSRLWPEPLRQFFEEREGPAESGWAL